MSLKERRPAGVRVSDRYGSRYSKANGNGPSSPAAMSAGWAFTSGSISVRRPAAYHATCLILKVSPLIESYGRRERRASSKGGLRSRAKPPRFMLPSSTGCLPGGQQSSLYRAPWPTHTAWARKPSERFSLRCPRWFPNVARNFECQWVPYRQ